MSTSLLPALLGLVQDNVQELAFLAELLERVKEPWSIVGFVGQTLFFSRFLVQWLVSEKKGKSVIPVSFWYLSIVGAALSLAYALHRRDPVFILGYSIGFVVYVRNLVLINRHKLSAAA